MSPLDLKRKKDLSKFAAGLLGAGLAYLVAVQQIIRYITGHPGDPRTPWIAAVPIVALSLVAVLAMRSLRRMDELERKIHMEAMAFAFLGSLSLIISTGFLALAGVLTLSMSWIVPAMVICWIIGLLLTVVRYR